MDVHEPPLDSRTETETVVEETILEPLPVELETIDTGPPLTDAEIGPEEATYKNEFNVFRTFYRGQHSVAGVKTWTVSSNTVEEFFDYLFELAKPHMKRAIEFRSREPYWSEQMLPTKEDLSLYITFKDRIQKRVTRPEQVSETLLLKWSNKTITLKLYVHSAQIQSRAEWELVKLTLFESISETIPVREDIERQKLQAMVARLEKIHRDKLTPKVEHAFQRWARLILLQPSRKQEGLCYEDPPESLMQNFEVIERNENRKRIRISGPAQREHAPDGFGFEDEVQALRRTVTQIRDLVEVLDRRVGLLEEKCHGFKQTIARASPTMSPRLEDNGNENYDNEVMIDEVLPNDSMGAEFEALDQDSSDPFIMVDLGEYVKQEGNSQENL